MTTTFPVVHLHRIGKCQGHLIVSTTGVAFVSNKTGSDSDSFSLKYGDFVQGVDKDALIIRSADRAYRFTAASGSRGERAETQLEIADTIARSRER